MAFCGELHESPAIPTSFPAERGLSGAGSVTSTAVLSVLGLGLGLVFVFVSWSCQNLFPRFNAMEGGHSLVSVRHVRWAFGWV